MGGFSVDTLPVSLNDAVSPSDVFGGGIPVTDPGINLQTGTSWLDSLSKITGSISSIVSNTAAAMPFQGGPTMARPLASSSSGILVFGILGLIAYVIFRKR